MFGKHSSMIPTRKSLLMPSVPETQREMETSQALGPFRSIPQSMLVTAITQS